jgi:mannose-6-phosphate isomerase-like protein (cupin superfamily)
MLIRGLLAGRKATIRLERDREFADPPLEESGFELLVPLVDAGLFGRKREFANDVAGSGNDADRIRVARSRRRAPLLKSVGASHRLSAGYVPLLERSGGTEGSNPVPSSGEFNCEPELLDQSAPIAEGSDMRARLYTLAPGDVIPWHHHTAVTDGYFCLVGILRVETRCPAADEVCISTEPGPHSRLEL